MHAWNTWQLTGCSVLGVRVHWDDPLAGDSVDSFILSEDGHSLVQVRPALFAEAWPCCLKGLLLHDMGMPAQATDMVLRGSGERCQYRCGFF